MQGKATPEQISNVEQWIDEDNANKKTLLELARIYYAQETQKRISSRDSLKAFNQVKRRIERKKHFEKFRYSILAAACLAGIITLSVFFSYIYESSRKQPNDNNKYKNITVFTNPGMRSVVTLPDGSIAYLNSGSSLSYPQYFTENDYERRISLQGEGYFKVKHNDKLPFIVSVNQNKINIRATGTEFNVQAYNKENNVRVTLVKGSVLLSMKKKDNKSRYTQLKTPQRVSYDLANESISMGI